METGYELVINSNGEKSTGQIMMKMPSWTGAGSLRINVDALIEIVLSRKEQVNTETIRDAIASVYASVKTNTLTEYEEDTLTVSDTELKLSHITNGDFYVYKTNMNLLMVSTSPTSATLTDTQRVFKETVLTIEDTSGQTVTLEFKAPLVWEEGKIVTKGECSYFIGQNILVRKLLRTFIDGLKETAPKNIGDYVDVITMDRIELTDKGQMFFFDYLKDESKITPLKPGRKAVVVTDYTVSHAYPLD